MNTSPSFYLDVLPAHPRPKPLESLNSYMKRLAQANGIHHFKTFSHFTGIRDPKRALTHISRYVVGNLDTVTQCTEQDLLALTAYFLGCKFGREQSLGRFLSGSVADDLRWCPFCLAEQRYFQLTWSFLQITGCRQHGIHFLEVCPHCQQTISLKSSSLALDTCPHCEGNLCHARVRPLTDDEWLTSHRWWDELVYLLTPQDWQQAPSRRVAEAVRQRLGFLRRASGLEAQQVAKALGVRKNSVLAIENETCSGIGETLNDYLLYVDYLGLKLSDVFRESAEAGYIHKDDLYAEEMLRRTQVAIQQLKAADIPVTQKHVGAILGYEPSALRNYPQVHDLLQTEAQIRNKRTPEYEGDLCQQIQQVIRTLNAKRERVTKRKVGLLVGHDPKQIQKFYPRAYRLLTDAVVVYRRKKPLREAALLQDVQTTIGLFRQRGEPITQKGIARYLGVSEARLNQQPTIRLLIIEQAQQGQQKWFDSLTMRMTEAMEQLLLDSVFVSRSQLVERLGITKHWFEYYPALTTLWQTFDETQGQRREADLVARTQSAILACKAEPIPLTFRNVSERVGLARASMKRYPQVLALLQAHHLVRTETSLD
jgi:DNA-binding XRE family transcriptional regulator